jgi:hypothetical protein
VNSITNHYIIDFSSNNNFVQVPAVQGDGNEVRYIEIEMIENGKPFVVDQSDTFISIAGTKPDGTEVWNRCYLTSDGYIKVEITYQMTAVAGRSDYQIVLFSDSKNNQIKSFPFILLVTPAAYSPSYIISSNEFRALAQYTDAAAEAAKAAKKSAENAALSGTVGIFYIDRNNGHLYLNRVDSWRGHFSIINDSNLQVVYEFV